MTNDAITICQATAVDLTAWARMRHQLWDDLAAADHQAELATELAAGTLTGYLALRPGGEAIAFAEFSLRPYANGATGRPVPFLEGIWVDQAWRRHGIGNRLIATITAHLRTAGFDELCSDAEIENTASQTAHRKWGFDETERVVCYRKALLP
jgi:aminoglycoside 6'-N-acetyltransferase I